MGGITTSILNIIHNVVVAVKDPKTTSVHQKKPTTTLLANHQTPDRDLALFSSSRPPAGDAPCPHIPPSSQNVPLAVVEVAEANSRSARGHQREGRDGSSEPLEGSRDCDEETPYVDAVVGNNDARLALAPEAETCL